MTTIKPCLWSDGKAEEAARFYVSLMPNSAIDHVSHYLSDAGSRKAGDVLTVEFTLAGKPYMMLNGGSEFSYTPAVSLFVGCPTQAEVDRLWDALIDGGGAPVQCGWLTDRYGLSWQIVPDGLMQMMYDPDPERAGRVFQAMTSMIKLDLAALKAAYEGPSAA